MSVIARFEVIPVGDERMSTAIADAVDALERYPVTYETTATDTIVEGDSVEQVFAAIQGAHQAIRRDRVITSVEIDEYRGRDRNVHDRVASVERALGRPPRRHREHVSEGDRTGGAARAETGGGEHWGSSGTPRGRGRPQQERFEQPQRSPGRR